MSAFPGSILEIAGALERRESTSREIVGHFLDRIEALHPRVNCFQELFADRAMEKAGQADEILADGASLARDGPLLGIPIAIKDNIVTDFGHTTCGSRMLEGYRSPYAATVVKRLEDAGAIILGTTRCDEFAMGSSTEHCAFGAVRNPWDLRRVPGGSSGGSAAAVAARLCPAALGSDTGGSIRQPASLCGIVGVKPTYGRVSRNGLVAFGSSLDQIGPLAANVPDAALLMRVIAGRDRFDGTSSDTEVPDYLASIDEPIQDLRIGVARQYRHESNHPAVEVALDHAVSVLRSLGAEIVEIDLPLTDLGISTYYVIATAEASSNLARYDGVRYGLRARPAPLRSRIDGRASTPAARDELFDFYARSRAEGFGDEVKRRIMLGTYVLSAGYYDAYYKRAMQVRRMIKLEYDRVFEPMGCHAILGPTAPGPAFLLGELIDPLAMYLNDVYTVNASLAGICAVSLPCGFAKVDGVELPLGMQLQCRAFDESTMFRIARMLEREMSNSTRRPSAVAVE